jgi:ankyrin repeat protein
VLLLVGCGGKADLDGGLLKAVEAGKLDEVTSLLEKGANVDAKDDFDRTPLMMSALGGHTRIAKALIDAGADLNAAAKYGQTALKFAEEQGNDEIAGMLRAAGARS